MTARDGRPSRDGDRGPRGVVGVVLAAGAGTRFGGPKALARSDDGVPWLHDRVAALHDGGCDRVVVVLGAQAERARALVPHDALPVVAAAWRDGMSASLREGLGAVERLDPPAAAALVVLVDLPGLTAAAVRRFTALVTGTGESTGPASDATHEVLVRATYRGVVGHPVLVGRHHWSAAAAAATGDRGAGPYLRRAGARLVECSDVADGADVDVGPAAGLDR